LLSITFPLIIKVFKIHAVSIVSFTVIHKEDRKAKYFGEGTLSSYSTYYFAKMTLYLHFNSRL
jgi:hypothetical protein